MALTNLIDGPIGGVAASAIQAISGPASSPSQLINGCKTVSIQLVISSASSPGTASAQVQISNDGANWVNSSISSQSITTNATYIFKGSDLIDPGFKYVKLLFACASGSFTATTSIVGKGPTN